MEFLDYLVYLTSDYRSYILVLQNARKMQLRIWRACWLIKHALAQSINFITVTLGKITVLVVHNITHF